ncbi:M-phase inducer phosphatase isoform X2 [Aplysia californica]|uniref:M-phase inducer phosphatase n=1 Tax=Aplysia californica TaxID=6500 RepID=A0ABM0ZYU1_APLCA|nr:M-phase inducer phosphatase isoform X2 [Aplysia californica]
MSNRSKKFNLPLRNIASILNSRKMSDSSDSGFSNLTNSPMSNLAFNLSELSTGRSTPRRRLSLSSIDTPPNDCDKQNSENVLSAESGCFSDSSSLADSPTLERKKTIAFRRISSQPLPSLRFDSPTDFLEEDKDENEENSPSQPELFSDETSSQDSGLGLDHDRRASVASSDDGASVTSSSVSSHHLERLPSLDDVWNSLHSVDFKEPKGKPPKRTRSFLDHKQHSEETCSPLKYSPVKSSSLPRPSFSGFSKSLFSETIPSAVSEVSKKKTKLSFDDGFQELFDIDDVSADLKTEANDQVSSLISATLLHHPKHDKGDDVSTEQFRNLLSRTKRPCVPRQDNEDSTPSSRPAASRRALLHRSQSLDIQPRSSYKRCEPPQDNTPVQSKKWRGEDVATASDKSTSVSKDDDHVIENPPVSARRFHRCHSETDAQIKSAVSRMFMEPDLIGDSSKCYCLPTIKGKHQDLKSITPETLSRVLANEFADDIEEFHIIDCRYPYEFEGGHIQNALNIYTKDGVIDKYLKSPITLKDPSKRFILIFHCEFSSERGPGLFRFLRRLDRETNKECYPFLHYPEIYLLEGGYKNFFEQHSNLCEPQKYLQMLDKNYSEDLRKFRAKCKIWSDDRSHSRSGIRPLKF